MRILLLEDDDATRALFGAILSDAGHVVEACSTISDALRVLRTAKIDLLVIDLVIGDSNSLGIAQYAGYAAPHAEIILVTGTNIFARGEVLEDFPGINWILRKPLPPDDLEAFVAHAALRYEEQKLALAH